MRAGPPQTTTESAASLAPTVTAVRGDAVVLEAPDADPDGAFADLVGAFAAALDAGDQPESGVPRVARVGRLERRRSGAGPRPVDPASACVRRSTQSPTVGWAGSASRSISSGPSRRTSLTKRTTGWTSVHRSFGPSSPRSSPGSRRMRVEPAIPGLLGDDDRHPVVQVAERVVRGRGHDRERAAARVAVAGSRQPAHSPARASGRPSRRTTRYGWRTVPSRFHS